MPTYRRATEIIYVILNCISIIASVVMFLLFYDKKSTRVPAKLKKQSSHEPILVSAYYTGKNVSKVSEDSTLDMMQVKTMFVRKVMLSMCVADIIQSVFNIMYTVWGWIFDANSSKIDFFTYNVIANLLVHIQTAAIISSAVWCVCIAIAIYLTTGAVNPYSLSKNHKLFHLWGWGLGVVYFSLW
jgi:hypothetical protein